MDKLSVEVLEHLFLFIHNPSDLLNARLVCRQWHALITNEYFLNKYFDKRYGMQLKQSLKWIDYDSFGIPNRSSPTYTIQYPAPKNLQGSDGVIVPTNHHVCTTTFSFNNDNYSVSMWLLLSSEFEEVTFRMRFNNFSLKFILNSTSIRVLCSHVGSLQTQTRIKIFHRRWFHMILTYSSKFLFYINGNAYPLHCTEEPLNTNQMFESVIDNEHDRYMILSYEGYIKFFSAAKFADIQVLPCALTPWEIKTIVEQRTSLKQLNMGRYLLDQWANLHWYSRYTSHCILF